MLFMLIAEVETIIDQSSWVFVFRISSSTAVHKLFGVLFATKQLLFVSVNDYKDYQPRPTSFKV